MPRTILYPEWKDENAKRRYPFADHATLTNGSDTVGVGLLLDAHLYPIGGAENQFLSRVTVEADLLTFYIADASGELCCGSVAPLSGTGMIPLVDPYERPAGVLLADPQQLPFLTAWSLGDHSFKVAETRFSAAVVHPMPDAGVRGIMVDDILFAGDVWLVGGEGVVLKEEGGAIRLDVPGDPHYPHRRCEEINQRWTPAAIFLQSLNGLLPNQAGNVGLFAGTNVAADNTLRVVPLPGGGGLRIELVGTRLGDTYVRD